MTDHITPLHDGEDNNVLNKKPAYPVNPNLRHYLHKNRRKTDMPCLYKDLRHFAFSVPFIDKDGNDTLWETVFYAESDRTEIHAALTKIYAILKAAGDVSVMQHLSVDRIDYCTFGNSNPFRIKIINNYNDNYDYYYIKTADASRIYGLELEDLLSPNRINYLVCKDTLVEEHIAGIPGDVFIQRNLADPHFNETRLAKEFIKFNERCFVKLLGDMRAYNFVIDITPDFDDTQYRIRAIDFDQQCYEGNKNMYLPHFFKENRPYVQLCMKRINAQTTRQYQHEERTLIASRYVTSKDRIEELFLIMEHDTISMPDKTHQLKHQLAEHYHNQRFLRCHTMGQIVKTSLQILLHR